MRKEQGIRDVSARDSKGMHAVYAISSDTEAEESGEANWEVEGNQAMVKRYRGSDFSKGTFPRRKSQIPAPH